MKPMRLDRTTPRLAVEASRRQILRSLGVVVVAGIAEPLSRQRGSLASICGADDSQDVEFYSGDPSGGESDISREFVAEHQSPVGNLRWNANLHEIFDDPGTVNALRWCSGTLISQDLFLTAGHCLENRPEGWRVPSVPGTNQPISREEIASNMHVEFGYQLDSNGNDREPQRFAVVELVEDRLGDLDYAILRLANNPGLIFGVARIAAEDVSIGSAICIIGHPEGVPKRISIGSVSANDGSRIYYDVDTRGGSAGAAVLAFPDGAVVGVHTNGGCNTEGVDTNHGVSVVAMLSASPILRELAER